MYPYILMIFVVLFYAGNILTGKAMNDLPPFTIAFFRLVVAFIFLLPIGFRSAWRARKTFQEYKGPFIIMTLTGVTFFNTFIYGALQFTTASNVSVLETVIPVVTVVLSALIVKEKLPLIKWLGVILSFLGAVWVVMDGRLFELFSSSWNVGDVIMIGAITCWAVYSVVVKQYMHLFPAYGVLLVMTGVSVLILLPFVAVEWTLGSVPSLGKAEYWMGFLYLGVFPSVIALVFYNRAVERLGASLASVFLNFLPVVTMIGAYLWLGETIKLPEIAGALLVIAGVILTTRSGNRKNRKPVNYEKSL
ncbi:Permease of the drug/metabolite transporter (DMT) superfamily [Halobacillus alkaliphilus]|uniref:Permease of the drug/metabolite transporter (DMT) superfamily n=1 Tax=Halobacillus alkaliphilus TaxID=396056 RepID=A0A1I2QGW2_9BACI|nr:DMT family transporter [Halobacillus alkaliphilus]SFG26579.1 Permease of the drug/metabolite transporter (DMT) superfamily [Halobacillus alkaliphilus]